MDALHKAGQLIAREYLRVSHDSSGRARSVSEQHDDNTRAGERHGFTLNGESYSDVSVSASRYSRKIRGDFARLLADLQAGTFGADLLVLWESSRGSRQAGEWVTLADRLRDAGVKVFVTTHSRLYDLRNWRDRKSLLEDALDNEADSAKKSDAIVRALAANAAQGRPHGRITYGYRRTYDVLPSGKRVLVGQEPEPAEKNVVVELFTRLKAGHSLRAIERDYAARGITTRTGKPFSAQHLRDMALRPAYGGYRTHKPGSAAGGAYTGPLPSEPNAAWPPLVGAETFWAVRRMLLSPERRTSKPGRGTHLLSMIARCGECGSVLTSRDRRGERHYVCRERYCVSVLASDLDEYAEKVMIGYLGRPDVMAALRERPDAGPELIRVRGELEAARGELAQLRTAASAGKLSVATLVAVEPGLVEAVERLEEREQDLTAPPALSVIPPGRDAARRWDAAPMTARRQAARFLCSPGLLGTLAVVKSPETGRGHRVPAEDRVRWDRP